MKTKKEIDFGPDGKELAVTNIEKEISPIAVQAISLNITDDTTLKTGVELLSKLNQYNDRITEEKEKVTKPLNEALKAERSRWKPLETVYNDAIASIRSKMTQYQTQLIKAQNEAQAKIAKKVETGYITPTTAVNKLSNLAVVEKEHATEAGLVQFREKLQLKIVDTSLIPREFMVPDEDVIFANLKLGHTIPGCELETIQVPVNYR